MKYHVPIYRGPGQTEGILTLCGKRLKDGMFLWEGASEYVRDRFGCKSCLRSAGQKRQSHQGQEDQQ